MQLNPFVKNIRKDIAEKRVISYIYLTRINTKRKKTNRYKKDEEGRAYFFFLSLLALVTASNNSLYLLKRVGSILDGVTTCNTSSEQYRKTQPCHMMWHRKTSDQPT